MPGCVKVGEERPDTAVTMLRDFASARYGSRRGMVAAWAHGALYRAGVHRRFRAIDWARVDRLVFVCRGNICRSAFAEIVAREHGIEAASCGLDTHNGKPAHPKAIVAARAKGYDLSRHETTRIESMTPRSSDLFVMMEPAQVGPAMRKTGEECAYTLAGIWGVPPRPYIHDPYNTQDDYFSACFDFLEGAVLAMKRALDGNGRVA